MGKRRKAAKSFFNICFFNIKLCNSTRNRNIIMIMNSQQLDFFNRDIISFSISDYFSVVDINIRIRIRRRNGVNVLLTAFGSNFRIYQQTIMLFLVKIDIFLSIIIFLHSPIMVKMFLVKIEKNSFFRRNGHIFKLVAGKFADNNDILFHILSDIKNRNSYISGYPAIDSGLFQNMIDQRCYGTFPLCSGNSDYLLTENGEENLRFRRYIAFQILRTFFKYDSRTFKDHIKIIKASLIIFSCNELNIFRNIIKISVNRIQICYGNSFRLAIFFQYIVSRLSLSSETENADFLSCGIFSDIFDKSIQSKRSISLVKISLKVSGRRFSLLK